MTYTFVRVVFAIETDVATWYNSFHWRRPGLVGRVSTL